MTSPDAVYPNNGRKNGLVWVVHTSEFLQKNLKTRTTDEKDVDSWKEIGKKFGLEIVFKHNLTTLDTIKLIYDEIYTKDYSEYNFIVVCFMTHGNETHLCTHNNTLDRREFCYDPENTEDPHIAVNRSVGDKPIVFFFLSCFGLENDYGKCDESYRKYLNFLSLMPTYKNVFMCCSAFPGFRSNSGRDGSFYMNALCEVILKHSTADLESILTLVNAKMVNNKELSDHTKTVQTPFWWSTATARLMCKKPEKGGFCLIVKHNCDCSEDKHEEESQEDNEYLTNTMQCLCCQTETVLLQDAIQSIQRNQREYLIIYVNFCNGRVDWNELERRLFMPLYSEQDLIKIPKLIIVQDQTGESSLDSFILPNSILCYSARSSPFTDDAASSSSFTRKLCDHLLANAHMDVRSSLLNFESDLYPVIRSNLHCELYFTKETLDATQ